MNCQELNQPVLLTVIFRESNERELNRVFRCFHQKYYKKFMRMLYKISDKYSFLKGDPEFYGSQAFNDGLLTFYDKINKNGFVEEAAKLETFFFSFCINKLRALTTYQRRTEGKRSELIRVTKGNDLTTDLEAEDLYGEQEALFQKALNAMDEKRRQYIILKKIHNLTKEEIAQKMGIAPDTVNNEVYRSFLKLKENVESLKAVIY